MNSNLIAIGPLVSMPEVNSGAVNFSPLEAPDTVYSNTEAVTLGGVAIGGAKVLIFEQRLGDIVGEVNSASYVVAMTTTDVNGFWSVNVESFVNFDPARRYAFYLWYRSGELTYSAPIVIAATGGSINVNHDPLEYQEPVSAINIWFNDPVPPATYRKIVSAQKETGELIQHKFYSKIATELRRVFPFERVDTPTEIISVTIDQSEVLVTEGGTVELSATVLQNGGADTSVTWFSADTAIGTVVSTGTQTATFTAIAPGSVGVTARSVADNSKSGDIVITVLEAAASVDSRAGDEQALQDLYNATTGASWTTRTGWAASGMSLANTIHGVTVATVDGQLRVTEINLLRNNLNGTLPESLANLKKCTWFNVKQNVLGGQLPIGIGSMTSIEFLYLSGGENNPVLTTSDYHPTKAQDETNKFTGSLPSEWSQLQNVRHIEVAQHRLTGTLPASWGNLPNVDSIWINGEITSSGMTGTLPASWGNLSKLYRFTMSANNFSGSFPSEWSGMTAMRHFRYGVAPNMSGTIPDSWQSWTQLRLFYGRSLPITGSVPPWFFDGTMPNLVTLGINYTDVSGDLPPVNITTLQVYELSYSPVTGSLPAGLSLCNNMQIIQTQGCNLSGPLTQNGWTGYNRLRNIQISGGNHGGELPANLFNNSSTASTSRLELNSCGFIGGIPVEWENFRSNGVIRLYLQNNSLSGAIPAGIADWRSVTAGTVTGVNTSTNFISHANSYVDGNIIYFESTGTLPAPLTVDTKYFVRGRTTSGYEVSTTLGGAAVDITTTGSGTITVRKNAWLTTGDGLNISGNNFTEGDRAALVAAWPPNVPLIV